MRSRQRTCQKKRSTQQTVWKTNFTWKGSSQFPEISQLFWHGICSALEYGQEIARIYVYMYTYSLPGRLMLSPLQILFLCSDGSHRTVRFHWIPTAWSPLLKIKLYLRAVGSVISVMSFGIVGSVSKFMLHDVTWCYMMLNDRLNDVTRYKYM